jgi:hypothetical protein
VRTPSTHDSSWYRRTYELERREPFGPVTNSARRKGGELGYCREKGGKIKYAEVFETCEYGRRPSQTEMKKLFSAVYD